MPSPPGVHGSPDVSGCPVVDLSDVTREVWFQAPVVEPPHPATAERVQAGVMSWRGESELDNNMGDKGEVKEDGKKLMKEMKEEEKKKRG